MYLGGALRRLTGKLLLRGGQRRLADLRALVAYVRQVQHWLLHEKLSLQAESQFGRQHGFRSISGLHDFRRRVPVAAYEYYAPYVEQLKQGNTAALLGPHERLVMFALTSGTTNGPKYIPITRRFVEEYRSGWMIWGAQATQDHPDIIVDPPRWKPKRVLQLTGAWDESSTASGVPCGAISGLMARMQRRLVRSLYCLPTAVLRIKDAQAKYYATLRLAVGETVGHVVTANPSTVLTLARLGDEWKSLLVRDIAEGTLCEDFAIPGAIRDALRRRTRPDPEKARELERIIQRTGTLYPKDYWPKLKLVGTWTGGTVSGYLSQLPKYYGEVPVRDIGLLASEGRMTIPLEDGTPAGVLDVLHTFFEFIPREEMDSAQPTVLEADELEVGKEYFILLTTSGGLFRYAIHDVVRCVGHWGRAPLLEFLNKGSQFSSVTGEKLSEYQVVNAVREAVQELRLSLSAFVLAPCWADVPYYVLLVEREDLLGDSIAGAALTAEFTWQRRDAQHRPGDIPAGGLPHADFGTAGGDVVPSFPLGQEGPATARAAGVRIAIAEALACRLDLLLQESNCEYHSKRRSGRLGPVRVRLVPAGTWRRFDARQSARRGSSLEQYKHPCLIADPAFLSELSAFAPAEAMSG